MKSNVETNFKNMNLNLVLAFGRTGGVHHPVLPQTEAQIGSIRACRAKSSWRFTLSLFPHLGDHPHAPEPRGSTPLRRIGRRSLPSLGSTTHCRHAVPVADV